MKYLNTEDNLKENEKSYRSKKKTFNVIILFFYKGNSAFPNLKRMNNTKKHQTCDEFAFSYSIKNKNEKSPTRRKYFGKKKTVKANDLTIEVHSNFGNKYRKNIWIKNYFVICYYVKLFIYKLNRKNIRKKFEELKKIHFDLIQDKSFFLKQSEDPSYKIELEKEYQQILMKKGSKFMYRFRKFKFSIIILIKDIIKNYNYKKLL